LPNPPPLGLLELPVFADTSGALCNEGSREANACSSISTQSPRTVSGAAWS